jgi:hypothetical protein
MKKLLIMTLVALGFLVSGINSSWAQVINFNDLDEDPTKLVGNSFYQLQTYSSDGFLLENSRVAVNAFQAPQKDNPLYFGSANLMISFEEEWAILSKPGGTFTLNSIDLHGFGDISNVEFFAYLTGNQVADQQFALNDLSSWHTVNFDSSFANIDSVKWQQGVDAYHSFDNIRLNVVPEPVSCVLFGVGGLTLAAFRRRRRK